MLLLLNFIQAYFTELANDEAYYWVYAQNMDWGYFDHPPLIAVLIRIGTFLFDGELGVRFFIVFSNALTLLILYDLTNRKNFKSLLLLVSGITVFHVYGFIAVPDSPLLLFTAGFFWAYRRYLNHKTTLNVLLLSLTISLLLYSKYHGLLILFFTLISNLKLFRQRSFYIVILLSIIYYLPHILWQIENDYPSYKYHVLNKSQTPYNPFDSILFILGQLLIYGPLISGILFYAAFKEKAKDHFERGLKFTLFGILLFFLISTLNARVEPNWTVPILVPLVILAFSFLNNHQKLFKITTRLSVISLVLFIGGRILLGTNIAPKHLNRTSEFHGWKKWAQDIAKLADEKPVVFINSYQKASKYFFYTGQKSLSLNNIMYRRNQYDLWHYTNDFQSKEVLLIPNWEIPEFPKIRSPKGNLHYKVIDNFKSFNKVWIEPDIEMEIRVKPGAILPVNLTMINHFTDSVDFSDNPNYPVQLMCSVFKHDQFIKNQKLANLDTQVLTDTLPLQVMVHIPIEPEVYYWRFSLKAGWLPPAINSNLIRVIVEQ